MNQDQTIIIGAGPAGLAVGACLKQAAISCLILEQSDKIGSTWHRHYDRLRLHTDKTHSALPFLPFPKDFPRYPARAQVLAYLESYAQHYQLKPLFNQHVIAARYVNNVWEVQTQDCLYQASNLVIAAGYNREPYLPTWDGQKDFRGSILHSSQYRNGEAFKNQNVLVVGFGNSGGEIAIDLWEHGAQPSLAVRSPVNVIPREPFGIPFLTFAILQRKLPARLADILNAPILRATVGDITKYGLRRLPHGPMTQTRQDARIPLIDVGTIQLIKQGYITIYPGIESFIDDGVLFTNGEKRKFDAVILATGYRPQVNAFLQGIPGLYDEQGKPSTSGCETSVRGLYFCGYYVSPTGMLREIALEAKRISAAIARNYVDRLIN